MFDPNPPPLNPDDHIIPKAGHVLGNMLQQAAGICTGLCQVSDLLKKLQRLLFVWLLSVNLDFYAAKR